MEWWWANHCCRPQGGSSEALSASSFRPWGPIGTEEEAWGLVVLWVLLSSVKAGLMRGPASKGSFEPYVFLKMVCEAMQPLVEVCVGFSSLLDSGVCKGHLVVATVIPKGPLVYDLLDRRVVVADSSFCFHVPTPKVLLVNWRSSLGELCSSVLASSKESFTFKEDVMGGYRSLDGLVPCFSPLGQLDLLSKFHSSRFLVALDLSRGVTLLSKYINFIHGVQSLPSIPNVQEQILDNQLVLVRPWFGVGDQCMVVEL